MEKSIKQIVKQIELFADAHKGIAQYTTQLSTSNTSKGWLYPLMFTALGTATIENGQIRINMDCYFLDQGEETDYVNKLSITLKLAEDFMTYFCKNEQAYGFYMEDSATAEPIVMAFEDQLIGYKLPIVIQVKSSANETLVPV
jgi:hypothetical protein